MDISKTFVVTSEETARAVGSGSLPVLATPIIVSKLEAYCYRELQKRLDPELTSVGISIKLEHTAPTAIGEKVTLTYEMNQTGTRHFTFSFKAFDSKKEIAHGTHERVVVDSEKFMTKLAK